VFKKVEGTNALLTITNPKIGNSNKEEQD